MSQASFIVLLLIMWAVVAAFYTVIFNVTAGPEQKTKEETPARPGEHAQEEHRLPHAA